MYDDIMSKVRENEYNYKITFIALCNNIVFDTG